VGKPCANLKPNLLRFDRDEQDHKVRSKEQGPEGGVHGLRRLVGKFDAQSYLNRYGSGTVPTFVRKISHFGPAPGISGRLKTNLD